MWRLSLPELPAAARISSLSTASGTIHNSADIVKAIALGADAVYIATAAMLAMGCHMCRTCQIGKCNWGIATQRPDQVCAKKAEAADLEEVRPLLEEFCDEFGGNPEEILNASFYVLTPNTDNPYKALYTQNN